MTDLMNFYWEHDTDGDGSLATNEVSADEIHRADRNSNNMLSPWEIMEFRGKQVFSQSQIERVQSGYLISSSETITLERETIIQGIRFHSGDEITILLDNLRIFSAVISDEINIPIGDDANVLTLQGNIEFFPNGQCSLGVLANNVTIDGVIYQSGTSIGFFSNGQVARGVLAEELPYNYLTGEMTQTLPLRRGSEVQFFENGHLHRGRLAQDTPIVIAGENFSTNVIFRNDVIEFTENGRVAGGVLRLDTRFPNTEVREGIVFRRGEWIEFNEQGYVQAGVVATEFTIDGEEYEQGIRVFIDGRRGISRCSEDVQFSPYCHGSFPSEEIFSTGVSSTRRVTDTGFRLLFSFGAGLGGGVFDYEGADEELLTVPPHPEDVSATTSPITHNTIESFIQFQLFGDMLLDFWQLVYFRYRYQFGLQSTPDAELRHNTSEYLSGGYRNPPTHRQRYDSGENAYTFIALDRNSSNHQVTIGFYPYRRATSSGLRELGLEIGWAMEMYSISRGWDRHGQIEIFDRQDLNMMGIVLELHYRELNYYLNDLFGIGFELAMRLFTVGMSGINASLMISMPFGFHLN